MKRSLLILLILIGTITLALVYRSIYREIPQKAFAQTGGGTGELPPDTDWFTVGANYKRTSWVSEEVPGMLTPDWFLTIPSYVSQKTQIIATKDSLGQDTLYVAAADGLYAVNPNNIQYDPNTRRVTSGFKWTYPTDMALGNSPTVVGGIAYIAGYDKKIHAVKDNGSNYEHLWSTNPAGAGFEANPIVVNNLVYAGNRDGTFYAYNVSDGSLRWQYKTGGTIRQTAAYSPEQNAVYFGSDDMFAYALNADTGVLIWQSDADPASPEKDKFPGPGFYSYWPVVYSYNNQTYVVFLRNFGSSNQNIEESNDLYALGSRCDRQLLPVNSYMSTPQTGTETWMHGNQVIDATKAIRYLDNQPETYVTDENESTCDPATRVYETGNRAYRRTYLMVNAANGHEYLADLEGSGQADDHAPITFVGGKAGTAYPPVVGADNVLYQRTNYYGPAGWIPRGGVAGWVPGSKYYSLPANTFANDEPSAHSAGGDIIYQKLMAEREAGSFNYTTQPNNLTQFWGQGGDAFLSYRIPELFRQGWPYGYWKSADQSPMIPFRGKVYTIDNNALIELSTNGAGKQYTWNETDKINSIRNKATGTDPVQLEGANKISGLFSNITASSSAWPIFHQQETYYTLRPDMGPTRPLYFNAAKIAGDPSAVPTQHTASRTNYFSTLTSQYSGGTLTIQTSPLTPAILVQNTGNYLKLDGSFVGLAYPSSSGISTLINSGSVSGSNLSEGWLVVWDQTENHRWFPMVITLENRPAQINLTATGVEMTFATAAGHISLTPLNGLSNPLPGKGPTYYADDRVNDVLARWNSSGLSQQEADKARKVSSLSRVFPTSWTESYSFDQTDAHINYQFDAFTKYGWNGGNAPADIAFVPPITALAGWNGSPVNINNQKIENLTDLNYPVPLGRWVAAENTNQLVINIPQAVDTWTQDVSFPTAPGLSDPLVARLTSELNKMENAGHLRPYYISYGILANLNNRSGEWIWEYFHNPADTMLVLLNALPLLSAEEQTKLRSYIQAEDSLHPVTSIVHTGFDNGAHREDHLPLPDFEKSLGVNALVESPRTTAQFGMGWSYSPKSFYALYRYAKEFGNAATLFNAVRTKLQNPFTANHFQVSTPYMLNNYITGYIGYIKLGTLAGVNVDTQKEILSKLLLMRAALSKNADSLSQTGFEYGGYRWTVQGYNPILGDTTFHTHQIGTSWSQYDFYGSRYDLLYFRGGQATGGAYSFTIDFLDMVPELGKFMNQYVLKEVTDQVKSYEQSAPFWFASNAEEAAGEVTLQPLWDTMGLFNAKAMILNEPRSELEKYLDVPAVTRGDLFYIQNLTAALEVSREGSTDINGDNTVDLNDVNLLFSNWNTPRDRRADVNGDNLVNGVDFGLVLRDWGES